MKHKTSHLESVERLYDIAETQHGYFTAKQAVQAGFSSKNHAYYLITRQWERAGRGVYRIRRFQKDNDDYLVQWALWSRNHRGVIQGVYSHQTALMIYELSDVNPHKIHMTVPPNFRRSVATPSIMVLHKAHLDEKNIKHFRSYAVTKPLKTILDVSSILSEDLIEQAILQGYQKSYLTRNEILSTIESPSVEPWIKDIFKNALKK